jgi:hypothetical protein
LSLRCTPRCCSPNAARPPGSRSRWAAKAIVLITPAVRRSTRPSKKNASTANPGRPGPRRGPRSLSTSRAGITPAAGIPRSAISPQSSSKTAKPSSPHRRRRPRCTTINRSRRPLPATGAHNASRLDGRRRFCCQQFRFLPRPLVLIQAGSAQAATKVITRPTNPSGLSDLRSENMLADRINQTQKSKTCRVNRGRSMRLLRVPLGRVCSSLLRTPTDCC